MVLAPAMQVVLRISIISVMATLPLRFYRMGLLATVIGLLNASAYVGSALSSVGFGALSEQWGWTSVLVAWCAVSAAGAALCAMARGVRRAFP